MGKMARVWEGPWSRLPTSSSRNHEKIKLYGFHPLVCDSPHKLNTLKKGNLCLLEGPGRSAPHTGALYPHICQEDKSLSR